ncbi:GGDEF domain-containing protein [Thermosulfurimonas sp. F29]|uniref:GGDEF domain-containing protein n=1 Tax=Thermosulfurimonas sp. F29 TaxID=2867247 RepID=UPI001C832B84|nr:GGDEF domain-containing protein [Thermosulfurimonas sp. F29]MBX6424160.1 GGDEF domain-containing protein [Thermosulfurimonas sp. F29]
MPTPEVYRERYARIAHLPDREKGADLLVLLGELRKYFQKFSQDGNVPQSLSACLEKLIRARHRAAEFAERLQCMERKLEFLRMCFLRDDLTGLWNRRGLRLYFNEVVFPNIFTKDYMVFFFDLNGFKKINDHYGHLTGDRCLQAFAKRLVEALPLTSFIARVYGDEFVAVVPDLTVGETRGRLIAWFGKHPSFEIRVPGEENTIVVSFAIGATNVIGSDSMESVLERADQAMYRAKHDDMGWHLIRV